MDEGDATEAGAAGDQAAFGQIYDRHADEVHDFCVAVLRDESAAAEALHDVFVTAARLLPSMPDDTPMRLWLFAIAREECLRRAMDQRPAPVEDDADAPDGEGNGADAGDGAAAWEVVGTLPPDRRVVLDLHTRKRFTAEEIGLVVGMPAREAAALVTEVRHEADQAWASRRARDNGPALGLTALLAGVPLVAAPLHLRSQVLVDASLAGDSTPPRGWHEGWPPPMYRSGGRRLLAALAAAVIAAAIVLGIVLLAGSGDDDEVAGDGDPASETSDQTTTTRETPTTTEANDSTTTTEAPTTTTTRASTTTSTTAPTTTTTAAPGPPPAAGPGGNLTIPEAVEFGSAASRGNVTLSNDGVGPVNWIASPGASWMGVSPTSGSVPPGGSTTFTILVDRSSIPEGDFSAPLRLDTTAGNGVISVQGQQARPPTVHSGSANPGQVNAQGCPSPTTSLISARVSDDSGIRSVAVAWRKDGGPEQRRSLSSQGGGRWEGSIGPWAGPGTVSFRVVATDVHGNAATSSTGTIKVNDC